MFLACYRKPCRQDDGVPGIMKSLSLLITSAKEIMANRRSLVVFFVVYIALIGIAAMYVLTNLATYSAVFLTFLSMVLFPVLFFLFQTMCLSFTPDIQAKDLLKNSLHNFRKVLIASSPFIVLAILLFRLLASIETSVAITTLRFLLFGFVFPLLLIHLWIETLRSDVISAWKNIVEVLVKAFSPMSVLVYFCGLIVFAFIPYLILLPQIKLAQSNLVILLLVIRLLVAFLLAFFGWIVTVNALGKTAQ